MPLSIAHFISCFLDCTRFLCEKNLDKIIDKYFTILVVSEGWKRHILLKKNACRKENIHEVSKIISFTFVHKKYDHLELNTSRFLPMEFILSLYCFNYNPVLQLYIWVKCSEFLKTRKFTWNTNYVLEGYFTKGDWRNEISR